MSDSLEWKGWLAHDEKSVEGNFEWGKFEPKKWDEDDVDIKVQYCGLCASDMHTASGGWGPVPRPQIVGHEIVGIATRVGSDIKHVKVGDLVGVGAQGDSCGSCGECSKHEEPYCEQGQSGTYAGKFKSGNGKGDQSYGGYSLAHRAKGRFVVKIPDGLDPAEAAPMLCGGMTVCSPLQRYEAKGKDVGIIGVGGLGHMGLMFAKALGAKSVTAISHSHSKEEDAKKMGADRFIATHDGDEVFKKNAKSLDLIVATTNDSKMPILGYLSLLRAHGTLVLVGAPEEPLPQIPVFPLIMGNIAIAGSAIGSPKQIEDMLALAQKHDVHPWIQKRKMEDVNTVVPEFQSKGAKYRFVFVNEKNGGKL